MSVMFASSRSGQPAAGSGHLIEFKAGRSVMEPGSTPEKRKAVALPEPGLAYIKHSQDDQLLHLCWQNRDTKKTELDLILFPGATEFKRIVECTDGCVFVLKFKESDERHLFWMQEALDDKKAEDILKKMNDLLSNPPPSRPAERAPNMASLNRSAALRNAIGGNMEDMGALGNLDQEQLMRLFSLMNGGAGAADLASLGQLAAAGKSETGSAGATPTSSIPAIGPLSALMRRNQQLGQAAQQGEKSTKDSSSAKKEASSSAAPGAGITAQMLDQIIKAATLTAKTSGKDHPSVELSTILNRANTQEVVSKYKDQFKPHLPDQSPLQDGDAELAQTVGNPQFQQAADFFGEVLQHGQLAAALEHFGLNSAVVDAAKKGDLKAFAEQLTAQENPGRVEADKQIEEAAKEEEAETASAAAKDEEDKKRKAEEEAKKAPPRRDGDDEMGLD